MTEMLRESILEEKEKTGCDISFRLETKLSGPPGMIFYHNPGMWTITLNKLCLTDLFFRQNSDPEGFRKNYFFSYITAQIRMDRLVMQEWPESYIQGLAMLSHIKKREREKFVALYPPRRRQMDYRCRGRRWLADDLYCDQIAFEQTYDKILSQTTGGMKGGEWELRLEEMQAFTRLPEIVYRKNGLPELMYCGLLNDLESLFFGQHNYLYPVLKLENGNSLPNAGPPSFLLRILETGGDFYYTLAANHIAYAGMTEYAADQGSGLDKSMLRDCVYTYRLKSVRYIKNCVDTQKKSRILADNRIAVERTAAELNKVMNRIDPDSKCPAVHSLGYR